MTYYLTVFFVGGHYISLIIKLLSLVHFQVLEELRVLSKVENDVVFDFRVVRRGLYLLGLFQNEADSLAVRPDIEVDEEDRGVRVRDGFVVRGETVQVDVVFGEDEELLEKWPVVRELAILHAFQLEVDLVHCEVNQFEHQSVRMQLLGFSQGIDLHQLVGDVAFEEVGVVFQHWELVFQQVLAEGLLALLAVFLREKFELHFRDQVLLLASVESDGEVHEESHVERVLFVFVDEVLLELESLWLQDLVEEGVLYLVETLVFLFREGVDLQGSLFKGEFGIEGDFVEGLLLSVDGLDIVLVDVEGLFLFLGVLLEVLLFGELHQFLLELVGVDFLLNFEEVFDVHDEVLQGQISHLQVLPLQVILRGAGYQVVLRIPKAKIAEEETRLRFVLIESHLLVGQDVHADWTLVTVGAVVFDVDGVFQYRRLNRLTFAASEAHIAVQLVSCAVVALSVFARKAVEHLLDGSHSIALAFDQQLRLLHQGIGSVIEEQLLVVCLKNTELDSLLQERLQIVGVDRGNDARLLTDLGDGFPREIGSVKSDAGQEVAFGDRNDVFFFLGTQLAVGEVERDFVGGVFDNVKDLPEVNGVEFLGLDFEVSQLELLLGEVEEMEGELLELLEIDIDERDLPDLGLVLSEENEEVIPVRLLQVQVRQHELGDLVLVVDNRGQDLNELILIGRHLLDGKNPLLNIVLNLLHYNN